MAKFLTLAQLQKEFGITMRSLRELMQREIYEPVKSIADQAKTLADSVRRDADEGRFNGAPGPQGEPGAQGEPGNPGFSPTVHVTEVTGGYRITITDESGAHDFIVYDGQDGQDGFSPAVSITEGVGEHTITIEDAEGEHSTVIRDGENGEDGYTPQRGVDYWTDEDKTEIVSDTEDALAPTLALKAEASDLADTDRRLGLLYDLTRGQAWRTEQSTTEAYSKVVPSGAHAAELESIGGKSAMVGDSPVHADVDRMEIYGKNYFDPDDYYNLYTNREYNIGGYATKAIHLRPNTTYTVSIHAAAAKSAPVFLINSQSYVSKEPYCDLRKASDTRTFTTGDDGNLYIGTNSVDAPTNRRLAELEIQIEIGSAATAYSPYHAPTEYPIPAAVRALEGYGQSEVGGQGNTVDFSNGIYTEYGHYADGVWMAEETPVVTDISGYLDGFDPLMDVEGGGALTFHQSGGTELTVPNSETYYINIAEALA